MTTVAYYRNRTTPVAVMQHTGQAALARMQTLVATWREAGTIDSRTRLEPVEVAGTPAALLDVPARPTRLLPLGHWLSLGDDGLVRVTPTRPARVDRVQAVQHLGCERLDEMDGLLAGWLSRHAIDGHTTLTRTDYRGQPAAVLMDSRRRGQLLITTSWLVRHLDHRLDRHLSVVPAVRFDAVYAPLHPVAARPPQVAATPSE